MLAKVVVFNIMFRNKRARWPTVLITWLNSALNFLQYMLV